MTLLRGLGPLSRVYLLQAVRSKTAIFWNLVFPLVWLFLFGFVFGRGDPLVISALIPGLFTITIMSSAFFGVSYVLVMERETGILRRYRVTPVSPLVIVLANSCRALAMMLVSLLIQGVVAWLVFDIRIAGSLLSVFAVIVLGAAAFVPLGLLVGSVAQDMRTAPAISNLLFFPLMFGSGAAIPAWMLPGFMQTVSRFIPSSYLVESLQGVMVRGEGLLDLLGPITVLLLTLVVGAGLNSLLFRWESSDPVDRRRLLMVVAALIVLFAAAALLAPSFHMIKSPSEARADSAAGTDATERTLLVGATILDGLGGRVEEGYLLVNNGRIKAIGPASDQKQDLGSDLVDAASVVDLGGKFVLPGLIDSHMHIGGSGGGMASAAEMAPTRFTSSLRGYLGVGVTTVVSLTDIPSHMRDLAERVDDGAVMAPRMLFAGASITAPGGHPAARFSTVPGLADQLTHQVSDADEARAAVQRARDSGASLIKLVLEEGAGYEQLPRLDEGAFRAAVAEAHALGLNVTTHVGSDADARLALDAGVDSLQHTPRGLTAETIAALAASGTPLTPTLAVLEGLNKAAHADPFDNVLISRWVDRGIVESLSSPDSWVAQMRQVAGFQLGMEMAFAGAMAATRDAISGGATILVGSDSGNAGTFHGPALIRELELLVKAGMSPASAIVAATGGFSTWLERDEIGRLAPGAHADFLVLDVDPTVDISALRQLHAVYFRGDRLDLDTLLTDPAEIWLPQ